MIPLLPVAKRIHSKLLEPSEDDKSRCKINLREDRLKAILDGTKFVYDEKRHTPSRILDVKPLPLPSGNLLYLDFIYTSKTTNIKELLLEKTISKIKMVRREERLKYIIGEDKEEYQTGTL